MKSNDQNVDASARAVDPGGITALIPHGLFIMASSYEDQCSAVLVPWVQRCSDEPLMVVISLRRGHRVEPLIRDSRCFTLCQISEDDRFLQRKFANGCGGDDEFVGLGTRTAPSGAPILDHAMCYLDCELVRNVELDSPFRLYVGQVHHTQMLCDASPAIFYRPDDE